MTRASLLLLLLALLPTGCGRLGFDEPSTTTGTTGTTDVDGSSESPATCWAAWRDHALALSSPQRVTMGGFTGLNNPSLSDDELTLYFVRNSNLYSVDRSTRDAPWDATPRLEVNISTGSEGRLSTSADGLFAIFTSGRAGNSDLWTTQRASREAEFDAPAQTYVSTLSSSSSDLDPELTRDGLRLYYAPYDGTKQRILMASRPTLTSPFGAPTTLSELQISIAVGDPVLAPDELVIAFSSGATIEANDLFFATRTDRSEPFGAATAIPIDLPGVGDWDAEVSSDGCELYFVSDRSGTAELYTARVY